MAALNITINGFLVKTGAITKPTVTGNQATTGVGFQPKIVLFFLNNATADGSTAGANVGVGFAVSTTSRGALSGSSDSESQTKRNDATKAITYKNGSGNPLFAADLVTLDTDGFTLNWTTVNASSQIINYLALGGSDLSNAGIVSWTANNLSTQSVTGFGFKPDALLTFSNHLANGTDGTGFYYLDIAAAKSSSARWATNTLAIPTGTFVDSRIGITTAAIRGSDVHSGLFGLADLTSLDSDGFTLAWSTVATTGAYYTIGLKGGNYSVSSFSQATSTGTQSTTGMGFKPNGMFLTSVNDAGNTSDQTNMRMTMGATDGTNRFSLWRGDNQTNGNSDLDRTKLVKMITEGASVTVNASADITSLDKDGFTVNWGTADATARVIYYLAFGSVGDYSVVSDVPTVEIVDRPNVFDSSAVTDVPTVEIVDRPNPFESSTATDVPTVLKVDLVNVFESSTVTDVLSQILIRDFVNTFDSSIVTDVPTITIVNLINVNDSSYIRDTRTNYVVNPSFETNTLYWSNNGGTVAQSTAQQYLGLQSMLFTATTSGNLTYITFSDGVTPVIGRQYTLSAYLRGSGTVTMWVYDGSVDQFSSTITLTNTWTRYSITATAQATSGLLGGVRLTSNNSVSCYIDAVMLEEGSVAGNYFDGSTYNAAWSGTADNSISSMGVTLTETRINVFDPSPKAAIHVGSYSIDTHTLTQTQINTLVSTIVSSIPNATHIAIGTYLDYAVEIGLWATAIHNYGKKMWLRSAGFNDWQGTNSVTQYTSADFATHSQNQYVSFINANYTLFQGGDIFEAVPDEPENNSMWNTTYGTIGSGAGQTAYNSFITSSMSAVNTALTNNGVGFVETGYVHTNPSSSRDIITAATAATLSSMATDDYPELVTDTTGTACATSMDAELLSYVTGQHDGKRYHITFGPNVNVQLSSAEQVNAYNNEWTKIQADVIPLDGLTVWQAGGTGNPLSRLFDYSSGTWTARSAAATVNTIFGQLPLGQVTEKVTPLVTDFVNVFDSSIVTDVPTVLIPTYLYSVFDSSTVTDVPTVELVNLVNTFDASAATDVLTLDIPVNVNVNDTSGVSDSSTVAIIASVNELDVTVFEASSVSDVLTQIIESDFVSVSDSSAVTDNITPLVIDFINVFDASVVSDVPTVELVNLVNTFDSSAATDVLTQILIIANISKFDFTAAIDTRQNKITNPSFETNTTGWSLGALHARSSDQAQFGTWSLKATTASTGAGQASQSSPNINASAGQTYTYSAYVYVVGGYVGNASIDIMEYDASGTQIVDGPNTNFSLTDQWQRLTVTQTLNLKTASIRCRFVTDGSWLGTAYFDGAMFEVGAAATSYIDGTQPNCGWDGAANASTSSTDDVTVIPEIISSIPSTFDSSVVTDVPTVEVVDLVNVFDSSVVTDVPTVFIPVYMYSVFDSSVVSDVPTVELINLVNTFDASIVSDVPTVEVVFVINSSDSSIVLDVRRNYVLNPSFETSGGWTVGTNGSYAAGNVVWPSADQAEFGTSSVKLPTMTASNNAFVYQDFTVVPHTTYKFSGYVYLTSYTSGFARINIKPQNFSFTYASSTSSTTQNAWTQVTGTYTSGTETVVRFILDTNIPIFTAYWDAIQLEVVNQTPYFDGDQTGAGWDGAQYTSTSSTPLTVDTVEIVDSFTVFDSSIISDVPTVELIDFVNVFDSSAATDVLTQITISGGIIDLNINTFDTSAVTDGVTPEILLLIVVAEGYPYGLISYYKYDENTGSTVADSVSVNDGTWHGTGSHWTSGIINSAGLLNGTDDYVSSTISSGLSSSFTISLWVNFSSFSAISPLFHSHVASYDNYWAEVFVNSADQKFSANLYDGTNNPLVQGSVLSTNTWYHCVFVRDTNQGKILLYLNGNADGTPVTDTTTSVPTYSAAYMGTKHAGGSFPANSFSNIRLDEVAVFNRALSATDVANIYNRGYAEQYNGQYLQVIDSATPEKIALENVFDSSIVSDVPTVEITDCVTIYDPSFPTGAITYYTFDENTGSTVGDSAGSATGTWHGTLGSQWTTGKINSGGNFNGTDNYVESTISSGLSGSFTISSWVNLNVLTNNATIAMSFVNSYGNYWFDLIETRPAGTTYNFRANLYDGTHNPFVDGATTLSAGQWYHAVLVRDASLGKLILYVNGVQDGITTDTTTSAPVYGKFEMGIDVGRAGNDKLNGKLDEVGVWSRALSAAEVAQLYNTGGGSAYNTNAISATDVPTVETIYTISVFDTSTASEFLTISGSGDASVFDSSIVSDVPTVEIILLVNTFDASTTTDIISQILEIYTINVFDQSAAIEDVAVSEGAEAINTFDNSSVSEFIAIEMISFVNSFDSSAITDVVTSIYQTPLIIVTSEGISYLLNEDGSYAVTENGDRIIIQPLYLATTDVFSIEEILFVTFFDTSAVSESFAVEIEDIVATVVDASTVSEFLKIQVISFISLSDSSSVSDTLSGQNGGIYLNPLDISLFEFIGPYKLIFVDGRPAYQLSGNFYTFL